MGRMKDYAIMLDELESELLDVKHRLYTVEEDWQRLYAENSELKAKLKEHTPNE